MGRNEQKRRIDQQRVAIGRSTRNGFRADGRARARAALDNDRLSLGTANMLDQQAGNNVASTARRNGKDNLDRSCLSRCRWTCDDVKREGNGENQNAEWVSTQFASF